MPTSGVEFCCHSEPRFQNFEHRSVILRKMLPARRPPRLIVIELCAVLAFAALVAWLVALLAADVRGWRDAALLSAAVLAGYLLADFASGFAHWFCDTFFEEDTPLIGGLLIFPFREHHRDPLAMTRHNFLELNGNSCLVLLPVLWLGIAVASGAAARGFVLSFVTALFATNLFHAWAHAPAAPRLIRWLQRRRWILSPERHAAHHSGANDRAFCVTSGWLNAALDRAGFFRFCERLLAGMGLPRTAQR